MAKEASEKSMVGKEAPEAESERTLLSLPEPISMRDVLKQGWTADPGESKAQFYIREVLLGVIICMAQVPESIAFAYLARVRPPVALHAAWVIGIFCSVIGGRPGMVNGATGAFAAIVATFLAEPEVAGGNGAGVELLFPSVMLAGVLMLIVWALKLDKYITLLPLPVMVGFCNGLAIVIGRAQLHPYYAPMCGATNNNTCPTGPVHADAHHRALSASGCCTESGFKQGAELWFMLLIMLSAMGIMEFLPKIPKPSKLSDKPLPMRIGGYCVLAVLELPSSMISIIVSILLEFFLVRPLGYRTDTIGDKQEFTVRDALPRPFFLDTDYDMSAYSADGAISQIITQGVLLCAVGCIESLMTSEVVSGFTKTPHHSGLVVGAMGAGNIISGFFGGMGGNAMIGLSTIACLNGGRGRVAPTATAVGILLCVSCAYSVLNFIPMAALAGIMIVVVLHTFKWFSLPMLAAALLSQEGRDKLMASLQCCPMVSVHRKVIRSDVGIMLVVSYLVVATNIVLAVGIGLGLSCVAYAWQSAAHLAVFTYTTYAKTGGDAKPRLVKVYEVNGPLFFAATKAFAKYFTPADDPEHVICTFSGGGNLFDYTMVDAMVGVTAAYKAEGKSIEFNQLTNRSVKMLDKAKYWTRQVVVVQESVATAVVVPSPTAGPTMRVPASNAPDGLYDIGAADVPAPAAAAARV